MKRALASVMVWAVILTLGCHSHRTGSPVQERLAEVPEGFSYPEPEEQIELSTPFYASSLSGIILDPSGAPMGRVLVEQVNSEWDRRVQAVFSDTEGTFVLSVEPAGKYYLRLSYPGFKTLLITVITRKESETELKVELPLD